MNLQRSVRPLLAFGVLAVLAAGLAAAPRKPVGKQTARRSKRACRAAKCC